MPVVFRMSVSPISTIFLTCNRIKLNMVWQVVYFSATFMVLLSSSSLLSFDGFLWVLAVNELWLYGLYLYMAHRIASDIHVKKGVI